MDYNIKLENLNFEGPFDLLLHLIKKNEMDIYDIKIYDITNEYLSYIKKMKEIDLEVTSEFIVVAATLLEIKSKMLLPKAENDNKEEEDPRANLIEKLVEYKKFKAVSEFLKEVIKENGQTFSKKAEIIDDSLSENVNEDVLKNITMLDLYNLYNELINRYRNKINENNTLLTQIPVDKFKIEDKMIQISTALRKGKKYNFKELIKDCSSKIEVVVMFLALLELIKMRDVMAFQEYSFSDIYVERIEVDEGQ
ncbi:segregation/condensation protein A [Clostridium sp. 19966]|uniref:segregation/condensation protein A n=1 Tax=Clostridium sp. 19966 TaxID=2768166 RepID=UPI0028DFC851|nr:segregation/condensation protein A [Clostridium sp. 19966]MDT8716565.1 segregation/condensation protein A [Clostridium sp. 19966]